jgi:SAM-dependent methyltransferase
MTRNFLPDEYLDACAICGKAQVFRRELYAIRESYRCSDCKASLRERSQCRVLLEVCGATQSSLHEAVSSRELNCLSMYEPGTSGPFRKLLQKLPGYRQSVFYEDPAEVPAEYLGFDIQDLQNLTYGAEEFDIVLSSDILEHVRNIGRALAEIGRVLKRSGCAVFTVPMQDPLPCLSTQRVDTSGADDLPLLAPHYHGDGRGGRSLVYTDFGTDIVILLSRVGLSMQMFWPNTPSQVANSIVTIVARKS